MMNALLLLFCHVSVVTADAMDGNDVLTKGTVPIYATGVLTCYNQVRSG